MKIIRYFADTDMRNGHEGLRSICAKNKINTSSLADEFVVFVNRKKDMLKIFAPGNIVAFYKSPEGKVDERTIQHIPACFHGGRFDYLKAVEKVVRKELATK